MSAVRPVAPLPPAPAPAPTSHNNILSSLNAASASPDVSGGAAPLIVVIHAAQSATPQVVHIHLHPSPSPSPAPYIPLSTVAATATPRSQHVPVAPFAPSQYASGSTPRDARHTPTVQFHNHAQRSSPGSAELRTSPTGAFHSARASPPAPIPPSSHSPRPAWRRVPTGSTTLSQLAHAQAQGRDMIDVLAEIQQLEASLSPVGTGGFGNPSQIAPVPAGGGWRRQPGPSQSRPNSFFGAMQLNQGPFGPASSVGVPLITAGAAEEGPSEDMIFPLHPTEDPALHPSASASGAGASPSVQSAVAIDNLDMPEPLSSRPASAYQTAAEESPRPYYGATMRDSTTIVPAETGSRTPDFPVNFPDGTEEGAGALARAHSFPEQAEEEHLEEQQLVDPSFFHMQMMEQHDEHQHTQAIIAHGNYSWEAQMQQYRNGSEPVTTPAPLNAQYPGSELWSPPPGNQASPAPHAPLYSATPPHAHPHVHQHSPPHPPVYSHSQSHTRAESPPPTRNTAASFGFDMGTPPARYASPPSMAMPMDLHSSLDMGPTPIDYASPVMHPEHGEDLDTSIASLMAGTALSESSYRQSALYHQPLPSQSVQRSESPAQQQDPSTQLSRLSPLLTSPRAGADIRRLSSSAHTSLNMSLSGVPGPFPSLTGLVSGHGLSGSIPPPVVTRPTGPGSASRHPSQAWLSSHALYQRAHPHPLHEQFPAEELGESQIYHHPHQEQADSYHSHNHHSQRSRTSPPPMSPAPASDARSSMMGSQYDSATLMQESTDEQVTAHERDHEHTMMQSTSSPDTLRLPSHEVMRIPPSMAESRATSSKRKTAVRIVDNHSQRHRERHGHGPGHGRAVSRSPEYLWPTMVRAASSGRVSPPSPTMPSPPLSPQPQPQQQQQAYHTYPPRHNAGSHSGSTSRSASPGAATETGTGTNTTATTLSRVKTDLAYHSSSNSPTSYRPSPASPTMYRPPSVLVPTSPNMPLLTDFPVRSPTGPGQVSSLSPMRPHPNSILRPSTNRQRMHSQSQRSSVANAGLSHRPGVPPPGAPRPGSGEWTWVMGAGDR
ncbi:hypothetical protein BKA62DRAFT_707894 [Auriculariales sp. MPI-PUGE-AT-0066]|nr:hypothetical protein BKA62DRAFT_707894 [Auriculariales sp. MPI-PUGE-AT-0066]